ncbi:LOW QUALITY PROTEIN: hypothetical protein ACHAWF_002735 [Thalassiosira exigua]
MSAHVLFFLAFIGSFSYFHQRQIMRTVPPLPSVSLVAEENMWVKSRQMAERIEEGETRMKEEEGQKRKEEEAKQSLSGTVEQEGLERERIERDKLSTEQAEDERPKSGRNEQERLMAEKVEAEQLEREHLEAEEATRQTEKETQATERVKQEKLTAERSGAELLEQERPPAEEATRLEKWERLEREKLAAMLPNAERSSRAASPLDDVGKDVSPFGNGIVHLVKTRLQQHQPHLIALGQARLRLFDTFCLPSILSQTSKNFLWIIRVDPDLHYKLLQPLVLLLKGRPNFILLGSNGNPDSLLESKSFDKYLRVHRNATEEGGKARVFSGNITLLSTRKGNEARGEMLLETRLDADDGLHADYLGTIQADARRYLVDDRNGTERWRFWCARSDVEWHPVTLRNNSQSGGGKDDGGYLVMKTEHNMCITAGLSFGVAGTKGTMPRNMKSKAHGKIHKNYHKCSEGRQSRCHGYIGKVSPNAVRARTSTSAGMEGVLGGNRKSLRQRTDNTQEALWGCLHHDFGITREGAKRTHRWFVTHKSEIAKENLKGQCTPGHYCT